MNKKGFAVSGVVYSVLVLFLILIFGIIGILGSRKIVLDKMKNNVISELNDEQLTNIYKDDSGANYPKLADKMIPVIYDEAKSKWIYADIYEKWYDYDEKIWANAVILKTGVVKTVGQEINEDEIALMYVWIPRYKYVMFNAYGEEVEEQQIEVIFEKGISSTGTVECVDAINQKDENGNAISEICTDTTNDTIVNNASTYTHPAFTFGDTEIEGFWVGKFENSTTDYECLTNLNVESCNKNNHIIEIKANKDALRNIDISNAFMSIRNISDNYGINNTDSHMIKNMEWGAVAYLTKSKYGRCTNGVCESVMVNNVTNDNITYITQTGCSANLSSNLVSSICLNEYNTKGGFNASTTGNIYGVYDMAGGNWETVMANMKNISGKISFDLSGITYPVDSKYYDGYSYSTVPTAGKLGDSTFEVINYSVIQQLMQYEKSWLYRGGHALNEYENSMYSYLPNNGYADATWSYRSILIKE